MTFSKTNIDKLGEIFGSMNKLAKILTLSPSTFNQWKRRHEGRIPTNYNPTIRLAARDFLIEKNLDDNDYRVLMNQVHDCLEPDPVCPHCKNSLIGLNL